MVSPAWMSFGDGSPVANGDRVGFASVDQGRAIRVPRVEVLVRGSVARSRAWSEGLDSVGAKDFIHGAQGDCHSPEMRVVWVAGRAHQLAMNLARVRSDKRGQDFLIIGGMSDGSHELGLFGCQVETRLQLL